jgi:PAS domain S-box-containing protein
MKKKHQARVLVIDDQLVTTDLQNQLHGMGYEVTGVASLGDEALQAIERDRPDLILLGPHLQLDPESIVIAEAMRRRFNIPIKLLTVPTLDESSIRQMAMSEDLLALSDVPLGSTPDSVVRSPLVLKERQKYFWLSTALNSAADGIMIVNAQGRVQFLNPAGEHLSGYPGKWALGQHFAQVLFFEHDNAPLTDDLVRLATLNEAPLSLGNELVLVSRDGQRHQVEAEIAAASEPFGALGSVVFTFRDVTQRKWEEKQHREEHAIRAVERLAETTAHTLNNLLTTILGNAELLLNNPDLAQEHRDHVAQVNTAALEVAAVVSRLSSISRKRFVTYQKLNVNAVIEAFLPVLVNALSPGLKLTTELDPTIRNLSADRAQLEQILFHLVTNARDAIASTGQIVISTARHVIEIADRHSSKRHFVAIKVRDTGEGMAKETSDRIFEPFFTLRSNIGRAGLGLSITQGVIRDYKGFLDVKSELGVGTEVTFGLPAAEADPFTYLDQTADHPAGLSVRTILVVEDDHAVRLLIRKILENNDYQVIETQDAEEAMTLAQLHEGRVDVLVADISLPGMSGPDLVRQFAPLHPETRFLLISGFSPDRIGNAASLPPNTGFLQKPFNQKDLLREIDAVLAR